MQEAGVPVTYAYISDAHDKKTINGLGTKQTGCTSPGNALGPADPCYKANLAAYDASFAKFFDRLSKDGITRANTLFVVSSEENDHYAGANVNNGFAYMHGYYGASIDITWLGMVGPGVANKGLDGPPATFIPDDNKPVTDNSSTGTWSDHTDIRPTILALTGLQDSYVGDGRVLTEDLSATPGHTSDPTYQPLAACYKQLNSGVGRFGTAALIGDTNALKSGSTADDSTYASFQSNLSNLGGQRDSLATTIKQDLNNAAFGSGLSANAGAELAQCDTLIANMETLAGVQPPSQIPETPWTILLPVLSAVLMGGAFLVVSRRRRATAATA
jgi:hypothetical protein